MCDLATVAGFALSAASAGVNAAAQAKIQNARDDAMAAERIRQNGLDKEAQALNVKTQDSYKNFDAQQSDKAKSLGDYFKGQEIDAAPAVQALPQSSSNIVVQEQGKQLAAAKDFTNKTGEALGNLRSFGDLMGTLSRGQARDASQIGQIGSFKRGSSGALSYELDEASRAGDGLKAFGDLLGGAGSIATNVGLSSGVVPYKSSLSEVLGYTPKKTTSSALTAFPEAPKRGFFNLYGG